MIWFTSDLHFFHDRILEFHPKRKEIFGDTAGAVQESGKISYKVSTKDGNLL